MPADLQASMSSVPAGATIFFPSTVNDTSAIFSVCQHRKLLHAGSFFLEGAGSAFQVILELFAELFYESNGRHGGGIAQGTKRAAEHVFRQILDVVDVFFQAASGMETRQCLLEPVRAFAAGNAPSATFVLVKLHGAQGELHDAIGVVEDYHATGAEHGSGFCHTIEVHWDIDFVWEKNRRRGASGDDCF